MRLLYNSQKNGAEPCLAHVSYSESEGFGAMGHGEYRGIPVFAPRGISYRPCEGDQILLLPVDGAETCVGVKVNSAGLKAGEIMISSSGGAIIHLRENGSISLNGLIIGKNGVIE